MGTYKHFLITRFNLKTKSWKTTKNGEEVLTGEWLKNRFELFEAYCLPSVVNQSQQNFIWYVFFDSDTPEIYRVKIAEIAASYQNFKPLFIDQLSLLSSTVIQAINNDVGDGKNDFIITTRMDNDDIIHKDFIASIQDAFQPIHGAVIDVREGYQLSIENNKSEIREYSHPFNAFVSLIESTDGFETIFSKMHYDWEKSDPVIVIDKKKLWIELVHKKNKINAARKDIKKIATFNYEEFRLTKDTFNFENRIVIFLSNRSVEIRGFLIGQLEKHELAKVMAKKIKKVFFGY